MDLVLPLPSRQPNPNIALWANNTHTSPGEIEIDIPVLFWVRGAGAGADASGVEFDMEARKNERGKDVKESLCEEPACALRYMKKG